MIGEGKGRAFIGEYSALSKERDDRRKGVHN
jgi:hypothetical protein